LAIADNKLGDMSFFEPELLAKQLAELCAIDFTIELTGFETAEVDILLEPPRISATDPADSFAAVDPNAAPISRAGDLWMLEGHRVLCANALEAQAYDRLLGSELADMVFTDPPYNVPIEGHVSGLGRARHGEFAMAVGEMSRDEFTRFLSTYMGHLAQFSAEGSIHFHCMDWRHLREILEAGEATYTELKALCVWNKTNGGMGSLYRSKHEMVLVYKNGTAPHINNVELGRHGRYRTNVWDYAGANTFRSGRDQDLALHPTVKPVSLVADAIRDCSKRGSLVLDPFAGSGTTILAAERTGRRAAAIELDPHYVDTAICRWQTLTGGKAILAGDGSCFDDLTIARHAREADHD
jgi:DNA modification methylase